MTTAFALPPVYNENSRLLILGSFPSVKSREVGFFYGNKQNRFWKMLSTVLKAPMPATNEDKRELLLRHGIALWDVVARCTIDGSKDDSITDYTVADVEGLLKKLRIKAVLLNGKKAFELFEKHIKTDVPYYLMPSTSPANPRYDYEKWHSAIAQSLNLC